MIGRPRSAPFRFPLVPLVGASVFTVALVHWYGAIAALVLTLSQ